MELVHVRKSSSKQEATTSPTFKPLFIICFNDPNFLSQGVVSIMHAGIFSFPSSSLSFSLRL